MGASLQVASKTAPRASRRDRIVAGQAQLPLDTFNLEPDEVRRRFNWAATQGHPAWLWPDVAVEDWTDALERIAAVTREVLSEGGSNRLLDGDASAMSIAGYTSGMGPLLGHWLETGKIACSAAVAEICDLHLRHNRLRMAQLAEHAAAVSRALSDRAIAHTFLKGTHTAHEYFPEPGARPQSDIDLLIDRDDEPRAGEVLRACGFRAGLARAWPFERSWRHIGSAAQPRSLSLVHADDPWTIDLHTSLDRRLSPDTPIIALSAAAAEQGRARVAAWPAGQVFAQPFLLLHLAVHAGCGLESLTLVRLVELTLVIRTDFGADPASWHSFVAMAERAGALGSVYPALRLCGQLAPGTIPDRVLRRSRRHVPPAVLRVVDPLTPATAHRVLRCSLAERFMWAPSRRAIARQICGELFPPGSSSLPTLLGIYRTRLWRLARRTLTD